MSKAAIYAIPTWYATMKAVHFTLFSSRLIVATAAMQGTYSSTKTRKLYAESGVKVELSDARTALSPAAAAINSPRARPAANHSTLRTLV